MPLFMMGGLQCNKFRGDKGKVILDKAMLAEAQEAGHIFDETKLAFLADPGTLDGQAVQTIIPNNVAFQTEDLDTYDSDCDDVSNEKVVLMANISNYGSDVISEVPHSETYLHDMENQSVHAMQDFEQTPVMDVTDNEITSDCNIILYFQYLEETQQENVQDTNLQAQQDSMILSVIEHMLEQMINHVNNWEKATKDKNSESVTAELERYKERVKTFEQRLNVDLSTHPKELPKVSLVNESLKKLKFHLAKFDNMVKIRTTPDARTKDNALDFSCKHAKRIQELLVYVRDTCPNAIKLSAKMVTVTPKNNVKKVRFAEPLTSSSNIKQVESSKTTYSNTPVLSPTGLRCFTGLKWKPTGRTFTIVGNSCPLTRITSANVVPPKRTTSYSVETQKPELKVYNIKPKNVKNVGLSKKAKIVESKNANHSKPNNAWGSNATDIPSSYSLVMTVINFGTLNKLAKDGLARGIPRLKFQKDHLCSACALGKSKKSSHQPKSIDTNQKKLYLLHMNLCGPMRVASINGKKILREFHENVGISHQTSISHTPQQNDVVKSSGLVSNPILQQPCIPPQVDDWDRLFQPMFDEYFNPPTIVVSPVPVAAAPRAVDLADSPVSTSIDQDASSTSIPSTQDQEHSLIISQVFKESPKTPHFHDDPLHESFHEDSTSQGSLSIMRPIHTLFKSLGSWTKDLPIVNVIGDPSRSVSTRKKLHTDAMWCYFDAFLTSVEPKNFKQVKTDEFSGVLKNKERLVAQGFSDSIDTPMVEKSELDEDLKGKTVDATLYRGMIGSIIEARYEKHVSENAKMADRGRGRVKVVTR
nr:integrase, catalytic region, zinc finger, CCHC-type, peptidase aspartic, catalytic [Tanacetum cinerariifolium]